MTGRQPGGLGKQAGKQEQHAAQPEAVCSARRSPVQEAAQGSKQRHSDEHRCPWQAREVVVARPLTQPFIASAAGQPQPLCFVPALARPLAKYYL